MFIRWWCSIQCNQKSDYARYSPTYILLHSFFILLWLTTTTAGEVTTVNRSLLAYTAARDYRPNGIVMNHEENVFFVANGDSHAICKVTSSGIEISHSCHTLNVLNHHQGTVSVFAGSGQRGKGDGIGTKASFNNPRWLAIDQVTGSLFVSDYYNHRIRKITPEGEFAFA